MTDDRAGWRTVEWGDTVRFRVPASWPPEVESREGMDVLLFRPAAPAGGVLNVLVDTRAAEPGPAAEAVLQEMTLRFVRPDDARASDRTVEERADGTRLAQLAMLTEEDGRAESHYLWLLGRARGGRVDVAMFSYTLPAALDGQAPHAATLAALDEAIRGAELL